MRRRKYRGRHVIKEDRARKPLSRRSVLLRLQEVYEMVDPKHGTQLTEDDVEIIDYNFALARIYDAISKRGEVQAIGFEAEIGGEEYEDEEGE